MPVSMLDWGDRHGLCRDPGCDLFMAKRRLWLDRAYADHLLCEFSFFHCLTSS